MILCAAIQVEFEQAGQNVQAVIAGHRHGSCWELINIFGVPASRQETEGFLNHQGEFLDRYDAFEHALQCGQLSDTTLTAKAERGERQLYSEDLY